jgi:hypothetical protein
MECHVKRRKEVAVEGYNGGRNQDTCEETDKTSLIICIVYQGVFINAEIGRAYNIGNERDVWKC